MDDLSAEFERRIESRTARVGVVGLGYVGLPLAVAFATKGFDVAGVDVAGQRVAALNEGRSPIGDVSSAELSLLVQAHRFVATLDYAALADVDVIFICVPTPFDQAKAPDLTYVRNAANSIASVLRTGQLVILESTTFPGTTDEVLVPLLERTGLRAGRDFLVAFSPERIDPGNKRFGIRNTPKVVGGIDIASSRAAAHVLQQVIAEGDVHVVSTPRVAEMTKLLENTFRAVNIALVNELAMLCDRMGIDVWEVIAAASTKPYGFMPFVPGPGVGGHCIPVDPYYLSWKAREYDFSMKFIELAADVNQGMPEFTVDKLRREMLARGLQLAGSRVLAIGAAFKKDVSDARNSPAIRVMELLMHAGACVEYHDPYVATVELADRLYGVSRAHTTLSSVELTDAALSSVDCVVLLVAHSSLDRGRITRQARLIFDAVGLISGVDGNKVSRL